MCVKPTVFVVDDDPGMLKSLSWLLESDGLKTETYRSAQELLERYDPDRPGCLVLDLRMPGMNGLELQEWLVAHGIELPIVFVTGHGDVRASVRAMKLGAVDFLEKPLDDEELLRMVRYAIRKDLERRRREQEEREVRSLLASLTEREREVMRMLVDGKPTKQIAHELGISHQTVAKHRVRIFSKLNVQSETELVRLLVEHSL